MAVILCTIIGIILCMRPANEGRRYNVTSSLIGWSHAQNDLCTIGHKLPPSTDILHVNMWNAKCISFMWWFCGMFNTYWNFYTNWPGQFYLYVINILHVMWGIIMSYAPHVMSTSYPNYQHIKFSLFFKMKAGIFTLCICLYLGCMMCDDYRCCMLPEAS